MVPGIRYVIFMQGCTLKCKYCHNRDTWDIDNFNKTISVDNAVLEIEKYITYMKSSGGGVTVSGGEPLLQANFIKNLFSKLKEKNIHTTIDTSGSLKINEDILNLLKYTDLVLLDIKHIDNEKCIDLTGSSNTNTISFAKYLSDNNIPIWIRQVLIPGITDNKEDLLKLKHFISTLKSVEKVEILPYHSMGKFKWENLGIPYLLNDIPDATDKDIEIAKKVLF